MIYKHRITGEIVRECEVMGDDLIRGVEKIVQFVGGKKWYGSLSQFEKTFAENIEKTPKEIAAEAKKAAQTAKEDAVFATAQAADVAKRTFDTLTAELIKVATDLGIEHPETMKKPDLMAAIEAKGNLPPGV
jgi:hypothetical protein